MKKILTILSFIISSFVYGQNDTILDFNVAFNRQLWFHRIVNSYEEANKNVNKVVIVVGTKNVDTIYKKADKLIYFALHKSLLENPKVTAIIVDGKYIKYDNSIKYAKGLQEVLNTHSKYMVDKGVVSHDNLIYRNSDIEVCNYIHIGISNDINIIASNILRCYFLNRFLTSHWNLIMLSYTDTVSTSYSITCCGIYSITCLN